MSAFVEECRREWKRLGVPELLAEEMASDLEADLAEASADGVAAEEILGESDPRLFAANWASERGLVPEPVVGKPRRRVWPWVLGGLAVLFVLVAVVGAVLASVDTGGGGVVASFHARPVAAPKVAVPDFLGARRGSATAEVRAAGLRPAIVVRSSSTPKGRVFRQTPAAGARVPRGSIVTLTVSR